jgi:capsular exopolysaccharide synthesis family protein
VLPLEAGRQTDEEEVDLRAYLVVVLRHWKAIVLVTVVVVAAALGYAVQQDPQYRAQSTILIRQSDSARVISDRNINATDAARQLNNEVELFESGTVEDAVDKVYNGPLDPKSVKASVQSDSSDVLNAHLTAGDADQAADLLNLYVKTFIDVRREQQTDELLAIRQQIQSKIDDLNQRIATAGSADAEALRGQRTVYQQQIEDLEVSADVTRTGVQVLTQAEPPSTPVSPKPLRDLALALVLGGVLGVGLAFVIDSLDERIRSVADLERVAGGLPIMSLIPFVDRGVVPGFVATRDEPNGIQAEAFRSLRTTVKFAGVDRRIKVIQVTSASQGDGKTTTVANLSTAFAQGGDRVVVACCDLRRPTVQERFGVDLAPGFTDVLTDDAPIDRALRRVTPTLAVLPAGTPPGNPSELLSTQRARSVIEALASQTDVLVIDSTPVLPVTDALVVSRLVDATIIVIDGRSTTRKAVRRTLQLLQQVNAPVIGLVLNGLSDSGTGYGYGYGYGHSYDDRSRRARRQAAQQAKHRPSPDRRQPAGRS